MSETQSAANHAKMVPMYHYVGFGCLVIPTLYFLYATVTSFSIHSAMLTIFAVGIIIVFFFARLFPLRVQDRVIRLEEQLRLARVLPPESHARIEKISTDLLIGLRFASDDELAGLVERVFSGELTDRAAIKAAIRTWRTDTQRI